MKIEHDEECDKLNDENHGLCKEMTKENIS